jgi:glycine/D-amino acid oxidase-like deaminating enzyme
MESIWQKTSFPGEYDLVITGAGITGLFTAWHHAGRHPDARVVVLERGQGPAGASVKNAGFACFGSPGQLLFDIDAEGREAALRRVEKRWRGLQELRQALGDGGIGFEPVGGYEVFRADDPLYTRTAQRFDELNDALHGIFGKPVFTWADDRLAEQGLHAGHLAFNGLEGAVDSGKLMRTLLQQVQTRGVEVRFGSEVEAWEDGPSGATFTVRGGAAVRGRQAVIATNGYARALVPGCDILPGRGQVVLTSPIAGLPLRGTFHMDEGYYYFRHYGDRVLLGGGRHLDKAGESTMEDGSTPLIQQALEQLLREVILPGRAFHIEQRWSGIMGFRPHGGPAVVEHVSPHVVLAAGLGGIGVAIGIQVAREAAALLEE